MRRAQSSDPRWLPILLAVLALATSPATTLAQTGAAATFIEKVDVDLVNVEAWVTDESGKPVQDLTRDAFTVLHDGDPVSLTHFSEIREGRPRRSPANELTDAGAGTDSTVASDTHLVVVLDLFRLTQSSQKRIVRDLRRFLASGEVPAESVLVLKLERRLGIAAPFGSTADDIDAALEPLEKRTGSSVDLSADHRQVVQALDGLWADLTRSSDSASIRSVVNQVTGPTASQGAAATSGGEPGQASAGSATGIACDDFVARAKPIISRWAEKERADTTEALSRLGDVASFLSGLEGPTTLLYASDGLGLAPGAAATDFVRGLCPAYEADLEIDTLPGAMRDAFEELARRMSSNRITLYAIQGAGITGGLAGSAGQSSADRRGVRGFERGLSANVRQGLSILSERTGGRLVAEGGSHERALTVIAGEMSSYYSLAYPAPASEGARNHEISVRLADPSLEVRHRRGYSDKTPEQWLTERLESALYLGMVSNPLGVRLGAGNPSRGDEGLVSFPLHVVVPVERLAFPERTGRQMAQLLIRIMALHAESRTLVITDRPMFLPKPGEGTLDALDLELDLELEPGLQMMSIAVQDQVSGEASFVSTTIDVPLPASGS